MSERSQSKRSQSKRSQSKRNQSKLHLVRPLPPSISIGKSASIKPTIINIMAASLDGRIATARSESTSRRLTSGFLNSADQSRLKRTVGSCDAVFIGWKSMAPEAGAFRVRNNHETEQTEPLWVIFSESGNIDLGHPFWKQQGIPRTLCHCTSFNLREPPQLKIVREPFADTSLDCLAGNLSGILAELQERGIYRIALLGGGRLNSLFWRAEAVDRLVLTLSPFLVGGVDNPMLLSGALVKKQLSLVSCEQEEGFLFLEYQASGVRGEE